MDITIRIPDEMAESINMWLDSPANKYLQNQSNGETILVRRMQTVEEVINHVVATYGAARMVEHPPASQMALVEQQEAARAAMETARKTVVDQIVIVPADEERWRR